MVAKPDSQQQDQAIRPQLIVRFRTHESVSLKADTVFVGSRPLPGFLAALSPFRVVRARAVSSLLTPKVRSANRAAMAKDPRTADLATFLELDFEHAVDEAAVLAVVRRMPEVQSAHFVRQALTTADYQSVQTYLDPAPLGHDVLAGWLYSRGAGQGIQVCDIEQSFHPPHEDLPQVTVINPPTGILPRRSFDNESRGFVHGTQALGVLGAIRNSQGVTGICNNATLLFASSLTIVNDDYANDAANALANAITALRSGDVLLIELGVAGTGEVPWANFPFEYYALYHSLIRTAVAAGIVVVAGAGNGTRDLATEANADGYFIWDPDHPDYFDSGAIIVGASNSTRSTNPAEPPEARSSFSNYSSKYDAAKASPPHCRAWGGDVLTCTPNFMTAPYPPAPEAGINNSYSFFGGTSSASAVIAGIAAALQGIVTGNSYRPPLMPAALRDALRDPANGVAQVDGADGVPWQQRRVGPLPVLPRIIASLGICINGREVCYAPMFRPVWGWGALLIWGIIIAAIIAALLIPALFSPTARCALKQWVYRANHLTEGNSTCVRLD